MITPIDDDGTRNPGENALKWRELLIGSVALRRGRELRSQTQRHKRRKNRAALY